MTDATDTIDPPSGESHSFQAEVSRLLHLMVHSVYSNRDVFLRELISNAADACEKLRFLGQSDPSLVEGGPELGITVTPDAEAKTLTIADTGIGMDRDELVEHLGTIAKSGTRAFLDAASVEGKGDASRLIGQFGVGFYSAFMVSRDVTVVSRKAGAAEAFTWRSDGEGRFTVAPADPAAAPARGTVVTLKLVEDAATYAEAATVERIVAETSAHVPVPIDLVDGGETRRLADGQAIWTKPKSELSKDDYAEFYRATAHAWDEPAATVHWRAEGRTEYTGLLFVPSQKPFDLFDPARKGRVRLYVRRVFITEDAEVLPAWLRFVRGVVDSQDLPLNISREMLQRNPVLDTIRKGVTSKLLAEMAKLAEADAETWNKVWEAFGPVLKEGLYEDPERRDEIYKLARFRTSTGGEAWRSLADVVKDFRPNQTRLYYVLADSPERAAASPHLEGFRARGVEVILLTDPVDAFWVRTALGYDGKPFQSITQGAADLDLIEPVEPKAGEAGAEVDEGGVAALVAVLKSELGDTVGDVRVSTRLAESAVCLVAPDHGPDRQLEKLLSRAEGKGSGLKPVLEVNPKHALIAALARRQSGFDAPTRADVARLLHAQAAILDGELPADPAGFARRLGALMEKAFA